MITYNKFQKALKIVNEYKKHLESHFVEVSKEVNAIGPFASVNPETKLYQTECSQRLLSVLFQNKEKLGIDFNMETKISELSKISMGKFLQCRCAGKKTLQELKELCFYAGVSLQR